MFRRLSRAGGVEGLSLSRSLSGRSFSAAPYRASGPAALSPLSPAGGRTKAVVTNDGEERLPRAPSLRGISTRDGDEEVGGGVGGFGTKGRPSDSRRSRRRAGQVERASGVGETRKVLRETDAERPTRAGIYTRDGRASGVWGGVPPSDRYMIEASRSGMASNQLGGGGQTAGQGGGGMAGVGGGGDG